VSLKATRSVCLTDGGTDWPRCPHADFSFIRICHLVYESNGPLADQS